MIKFSGILLIVLAATLPANAQTLDFEDLTPGILPGGFFVTNGTTLDNIPTVAFGELSVETVGAAGGTGNELFLTGWTGLGFSLPGSSTSLTMKIGRYASNGEFTVNFGEIDRIDLIFSSLAELDGASLGSINFTLLSSQAVTGGEIGVLSMTGSISSFELFSFSDTGLTDGLYIDDVVAVPEPATMTTLLMLGSCVALRRRR